MNVENDREEIVVGLEGEETNWAMFAHLSALAGFLVPFGNILAPLVIWQIKKDVSTYVTHHAKEAMNFQITVTIGYLLAALLTCILIGFVLLPALIVASVVFLVIAALKAQEGRMYRYPYTLRLVK